MAEQIDLDNIPQAAVVPKKKMRFSVVWIIPVVAAVVAIGIAVQRILSEGPTITIVFKAAEGVEAGKTFVKYKDVNIGQVKTVKLSSDYTKVVVTAKIDKSAEGLIVEDAEFWVEQPRVTLSGVSGIGTLLTGNFIGLRMGKSKQVKHKFIGRDAPPAVTVDQPGRIFMLQADNLGSVGIGSPLYYRRLNVGQVIGYDLAGDGKSLQIKIFVNAPYDKYVTNETRFWEASGIDVSMGASGFTVETQSVVSMLVGGIAFEAPSLMMETKPADANAVFTLFRNRATAMTQHETIVTPYVLYFDESLVGLSVGAPVTYRGLPVGEVTAVGLEYDPAKELIRPRVDIQLYPSRFMSHVKKSAALDEQAKSEGGLRAFLQKLMDKGGVRAQLRSGNILTGQLYVAFDNFRGVPKVKIDWTKTPAELPVMPSGMEDLKIKINNVLAKLDRIPLAAIGEDMKKLLTGLNGLVKRVDRDVLPELKTTLEDLNRVLKSTDATLVGKDAPAQQEMRDALQEVRRAAQAISGLVDYLERNPEALVRGKTQEKSK
ncbi:MAG: MlaD family protein [Smithella sp.]